MQHKAVKLLKVSRLFFGAACSLALFLGSGSALLGQNQTNSQRIEPAQQRIEPQGQAASPEAAPSATAPTAASDYIIGPEDVLRIDVFNVPELSGLELRVANDGTITPPLLGHVQAAGLTPSQLRSKLESEWGAEYLQNPQVSVFVKEFHALPVSIVGAVQTPGLYQLTGPRTLIEMLSMAGGVAKGPSSPAGRYVYITRQGGFQGLKSIDGMRLVSPDKVEVDLRKLLYSQEDALNISIHPRDIISVSKADIVYVTGRGVTRPGGYLLSDRDTVTVFQALAMAEGLGPNAAGHDARIIRKKADGSRLEIPVDLVKVLKGREPDPVLAANDILFVPDSAQKAALKKGAQAMIGTISGLLIYGRF